ncbi:MAG TPA: flagellar biosynthetic protein FliQ [Planctomycetota bacterium]|jgi:flagellar biosynthetic protein FliQ|nr:flagellar biosynthetic protein FliQ [Planctomycetota bacterium]
MDSASVSLAVDLARQALWVAAKLSLPVLLTGLTVGLVVAVLQAATQVQDATVNQVPKMLAVGAALFLAMPWLLATLVEYCVALVRDMGAWFR